MKRLENPIRYPTSKWYMNYIDIKTSRSQYKRSKMFKFDKLPFKTLLNCEMYMLRTLEPSRFVGKLYPWQHKWQRSKGFYKNKLLPLMWFGSSIMNLTSMHEIFPPYLQHICISDVRCGKNMDNNHISKLKIFLDILDVSIFEEFNYKFVSTWSHSWWDIWANKTLW